MVNFEIQLKYQSLYLFLKVNFHKFYKLMGYLKWLSTRSSVIRLTFSYVGMYVDMSENVEAHINIKWNNGNY